MRPARRNRLAPAIAGLLLVVSVMVGCDTGFAGGCIGERDGAVAVPLGTTVELPGGNDASLGIASVRLDRDPPAVTLALDGEDVTDEERKTGADLTIDDEFSAGGADYVLVGACSDEVWVDPAT